MVGSCENLCHDPLSFREPSESRKSLDDQNEQMTKLDCD